MVTSPAAETPAQTAARHRAEISSLRRWTRIVLIGGTAVSMACALGPPWVARLGLLPALGAAFAGCLLAWREIALERRAHAAAMLAVSRRHGAQLSEERRHNVAILTAMTGRLESTATLATSRAATIHRLTGDLTRLHGDVEGLRGANSRLTRDLNFRNLTIAELRDRVAARDALLLATRSGHEPIETDAEVHQLRRRTAVVVSDGDETALFDPDGAERRTADFLAAESLAAEIVSMPNYEEDRRSG